IGAGYPVYVLSYSPINMSNNDFRNNILSADQGYAMYTNYLDTMFSKFDNNAFYTKGANLLYLNNTAYPNLAAYQAVSPQFNTSSIEGNPQFFDAEENLHIMGSFVNDKGDASVGITVDIDGDTRPMPFAATVDIGADE